MNISDIANFFEELNINEDNTQSIKPYIKAFDAFSRLIGQSFYVVDYQKRGFVYVSSNPLFLCGYTSDEVLKMGYSFYKKIVVEEDLKLLLEIDEKGYDLFCQLSIEERKKSVLSFNYQLKQPGGKIVMVNEQNTPLFLTEQGDVRFALCIITLSTHSKSGNVKIVIDNQLYSYIYSLEKKRWKVSSKVNITNREKEILLLAARGYSNDEIAGTLFIGKSTVKFHKANIFSKLNVKNIVEAIGFAYNNKLI